MKTSNKIATLLMVATAFLAGCNKEEQPPKTSLFFDANIKVKVEQNVSSNAQFGDTYLFFETREAYEKAINSLAEHINEGCLQDFENTLNFYSLRKAVENGQCDSLMIDDDLFATLLNPYGMIRIENHLFKINANKETVDVFSCNEKNAHPVHFSTNDDVFDMMDGKAVLKDQPRDDNDILKATHVWHTDLCDVECILKYFRGGVYFSLFSKIVNKNNISGGNFLRLNVLEGTDANGQKYEYRKVGAPKKRTNKSMGRCRKRAFHQPLFL